MRYGCTRAPFAIRTRGCRRYSTAGPTRRSARFRWTYRFAALAEEGDEREYAEMFGTYCVGGGTTTNALAFSKVVRTRLKVFDAGFVEVSDGHGASETWRSFRAWSSEGDAGRDDTAVHEELVDETELWRARCHRENSPCYQVTR